MSCIPWRMHPSFILTCVFHSLLFGSVGFLHLCIWQTTHSTLICSLTLPFVRTRHVFKSSDTNLHRHSFSFNPSFHLWPLTCSLSSLVSFTSYLISAFWNSAFQILGRKVFWIPRNVHLCNFYFLLISLGVFLYWQVATSQLMSFHFLCIFDTCLRSGSYFKQKITHEKRHIKKQFVKSSYIAILFYCTHPCCCLISSHSCSQHHGGCFERGVDNQMLWRHRV